MAVGHSGPRPLSALVTHRLKQIVTPAVNRATSARLFYGTRAKMNGPLPAASSRDLPDAGGIWGPPWTDPGTRDMNRPRPHARLGLAAVGLCILMMVAIPLARSYLPRTTVGFVSRSLTELRSDGRDFRFDGLNIPDATGAPCWYPSDLSKNLDAIGPGQEVARVFSFQRTATTNGARDWTYVDRMLSIFRAHGERVIMVLTDQWKGQPCADSATDRTLAWYQIGYRTTIEGATTYRDWVSQVVGRYRDDPTIAFWQLVNEGEARNLDGTCSESIAREALRAFADDICGFRSNPISRFAPIRSVVSEVSDHPRVRPSAR